MALTESFLASEILASLDELTGDNPPASPQLRIAQAFGNYFKQASTPSAPIAASVDAAVSAMAGSMSFPHGNPEAGAAALVGGFSAFWTSMQAAAATAWPGHLPGMPPPGLASLAAALSATFILNNVQDKTKLQAALNLAAAIHPNAGIGGTVILPPSTPVPIT